MTDTHPSLQYDCPKSHADLFVRFLLLYEISTYIANDMIMPGILDVIHHFKASESLVSASLTVFILGGATLQIFLGPLSDRFGRRPVMMAGVIFFLCATLFISFSFSMTAFMWGRFFQGMGLCFITVIGYATLHELYTELHAVRLISLMNMVTLLAPLAGPLLGAVVIHVFSSWRLIFVIIACMAFAALIGLYFYMPETLDKIKKDGTRVPFTSLKPAIVKNNYLALLKNKAFMYGAMGLGWGSVPIIAWIGLSPVILMQESHLSVFSYALWQMPVFMASTIGNLVMRNLTHFINLSRLVLIGTVVMGLSAALMVLCIFILNIHYIAIIIGISCYAFAWGLTSGPLTRLTLFSTFIPKGTASAVMNLTLMLWIAAGNQIAGFLYVYYKNISFSLFCGAAGGIYIVFYGLFYKNFNHLERRTRAL
jgi:DHA1 family multidrug/chloramphenicol efflux transport protein-like MFS transporter